MKNRNFATSDGRLLSSPPLHDPPNICNVRSIVAYKIDTKRILRKCPKRKEVSRGNWRQKAGGRRPEGPAKTKQKHKSTNIVIAKSRTKPLMPTEIYGKNMEQMRRRSRRRRRQAIGRYICMHACMCVSIF